ncbi:MAG: hypothetical protein ACKONH_07685, partial [Planctomycetia bacterium]
MIPRRDRIVAAVECGLIVIAMACAGARGADPAAGDRPPKMDVEGQPLAANVRRLLDAYAALGAAWPEAEAAVWLAAADARDASRLQDLLDPHVLLVVAVNPETRVKVRRGPAAARLQQGGFVPVLVKILNESTSTQRIRMTSPQAGPPYAGVEPLSLERQQQTDLLGTGTAAAAALRDRFLGVEWHGQPPMTDRLSGLAVEYGIAVISSAEAGRREATIGFDLGQGNQDVGFRGEVPVLFEVRPAVPGKVNVTDFDGTPTTGRFLITE